MSASQHCIVSCYRPEVVLGSTLPQYNTNTTCWYASSVSSLSYVHTTLLPYQSRTCYLPWTPLHKREHAMRWNTTMMLMLPCVDQAIMAIHTDQGPGEPQRLSNETMRQTRFVASETSRNASSLTLHSGTLRIPPIISKLMLMRSTYPVDQTPMQSVMCHEGALFLSTGVITLTWNISNNGNMFHFVITTGSRNGF